MATVTMPRKTNLRTTSSQSSPQRQLSRRQLLAFSGPAAAAGALALSRCRSSGHTLVCQHQRSGEVYAEWEIAVGSTVTHSWVHSIELSRWTDLYRFTGEELVLTSTEFEEYGAGMPLDEGDLRMADGKVILENIDRPFDAIRWIHSHQVDYRIGVNSRENLIAAVELPEGEPIELRPR